MKMPSYQKIAVLAIYVASYLSSPSLFAADAATSAAQFSAEAKWDRAGYNNDEVIYSVYITNNDSRILSCTTRIQGFYFSNGKKSSIADQQVSTLFPQQKAQAGIWLDMDEQSGAKYEVTCKPR